MALRAMTRKFRQELLKQLVTLSTAGFGLVAALAWNEAVQSFVREYITPFVSPGSDILSKFVYALVITSVAVLVTYQLTKLVKDNS